MPSLPSNIFQNPRSRMKLLSNVFNSHMVSYIVINNFSVSFGISGRSFYPSHNTLRLIDRFEKYMFFTERLIADFVQFSNAIANFYFCKVRFS